MLREIDLFILKHVDPILYSVTFFSFLCGLVIFAGVTVHWFYFHRDRRHKLAWVITMLITSLAFYVLAAGLAYDSAIFYVSPTDYHNETLLRVSLKLLKAIASFFMMCMVIYTLHYYWKYMRLR